MHPAGRHDGFIAQEVQRVFPEWVGKTPDGYLAVGPTGFEALSVEALRQLREEKDAEIADLHGRLDHLASRLAKTRSGEGQSKWSRPGAASRCYRHRCDVCLNVHKPNV